MLALHTLPDLRNVNLRNSRPTQFFFTLRTLNKLFENALQFSLRGMKAQRDEGGGRILLGDNRGGGAVMVRPIRFQCDGVLISTGLPCICIYTWCTFDLACTQMRLASDVPERNYCVRR